ncbi:DUF6788 family protein [Verrucomicrobiaceae bacterium 227]
MPEADLSKFSVRVLRTRRRKLIERLPPLESLLRGSVIERYKRCGNAGCHCQQGRGHGPKYYLSVSYPKSRPKMIYVPETFLESVRESLADFTGAGGLLKEVCAINLELLRRREPFEESS